MKITVAKSAGFCFGVQRAIDMALETVGNCAGKPVQMLGDIVHNERVVEQINRAGVQVIDSLERADPNGILVIRAHGTGPDTYEASRRRGLEIVDATCPLVTDIHEKARDLAKNGYPVIVIGDHDHDEVRGIAAQVPGTIVISGPEEVGRLPGGSAASASCASRRRKWKTCRRWLRRSWLSASTSISSTPSATPQRSIRRISMRCPSRTT
jgi:4-hydroxy-3-methylbut-2-en-1-yl diphosphate reductase